MNAKDNAQQAEPRQFDDATIAAVMSGAQQAEKDDDIGPCDPTAENHGFDRTASHSAGTYVCECGGNGEMAAKDGAE